VSAALKKARKALNLEYGHKNFYFHDQFTKDNLDRSEILLLFAHFERFMQDLHQDILQAEEKALTVLEQEYEPGKKFSKNNEKFADADIFEDLAGFKAKRIKWQAEELNRKGIDVRAKYFRKLGIEWGTKTEILLVKQISDLRNTISHESAHELVPSQLVQKAEKVLLDVPHRCHAQAKKLHSQYFKIR